MLTRKVLRSSTFGLVVLYMLLVSASVFVLFGYLYWATVGYMARQMDLTIRADIRGLAEQYRQLGVAGLTAVIAERVAKAPRGASVYLLADDDYTPLVGNLSRWPRAERLDDGWLSFKLKDVGPPGSGERLGERSGEHPGEHWVRAREFVLFGGLRLLVGRDTRDLDATRRLIVNALGWGLAITLALAFAGGVMMTSTVVRRIEAINQTSREIMEGDLRRRVPTRGTGDDFDQLAENLNAMLDRITDLMESVRQVSDNVAHDLRTPLTRLRNRLELARSQQSSVEAPIPTKPTLMNQAIDHAIEEADALLATFNALLRIARIEAGSRRIDFSEVDLSALLTDVVELYEPVAAEKEQIWAVEIPGNIRIEGDRDLLFQALANIVDNAIKYTPQGGHIRVMQRVRDESVEVIVADSGPGIPPELREKVFERFFRIEASRTTPGSGLGLSLVKAVAALHRAQIRLEDNQPGLRVVLTFHLRERGTIPSSSGTQPSRRTGTYEPGASSETMRRSDCRAPEPGTDPGSAVAGSATAAVGPGDNLEKMSIRVLEVHTAAAVIAVDLTRSALTRVCPVADAALADAGEDLIKLGLSTQEGIVLRCDLVMGLVEIEAHAVVQRDHLERTEAGDFGQSENFCEKSRGCLPVTCHHDGVIELHSHGVLLHPCGQMHHPAA